MRINAFLLLTTKKLKQDLSFRTSTLVIILQPVLWLSIFLFLRESHIFIEIGNTRIRYVDFLVLGIFVWRTVSFIFSKLSSSIREDKLAVRGIMTAPKGERILLFSSITATLAVAMVMGACTLLSAVLIYHFSIFLNQLILAVFVFVLIIVIHLEMAIILISIPLHIKDAKSIGFVTTTVFGLLSGVFFPVQFFPHPMDLVAYLIPLTQGISLLRELLLFADPLPNWSLLSVLAFEATGLYFISTVLYRRNFRLTNLQNWY